MGSVKIRKIEYKGWKNCVELSNDAVNLVVTTDVGPRIIRYGFIGKENELCEVESHLGSTGGDEWKMYGGHRLWHSPEAMPRTYEPDNSSAQWKEIKNGIVVRQNVEQLAGIIKEMEITLSEDDTRVTILHRFISANAWPVELSLWPITVMAAGGREIMPQITRNVELLPNRSVALWSYSKMNDPRVFWGEKYITLKQDSSVKYPFKIGFPNEDGWAAYANHGHLFVKQYKQVENAVYPDFGSSYETYVCDFMLEMETLSPLVKLNPGASAEHAEVWSLFDNVNDPKSESEIDELVLPLIK